MADCGTRTSPNARLLRGDTCGASMHGGSMPGALSASALTHTAGFLLLALQISRLPADNRRSATMSNEPAHITWLPQTGPSANDGGSGASDRSRRAELPGRQPLTVPAIELASSLSDAPSAEQPIQIPAVTMMGDAREVPGVLTTLPFDQIDWQGRGTGGRPGDSDGTGSGPGHGSGPGGTGGEASAAGSGVTAPRLITETKPAYTAAAMRASVQGTVRLEAIVLPDGSVGRVRIVRSLDTTFGLDQQALAAVRSWRFMPGTVGGRPAPVLVNIELLFTLR